MILDGQNTFSNLASGDAPTLVGDTPAANDIDQMAGGGAIGSRSGGAYVAPWVIVRTSTAATSGGAATVQAVLQDSPDDATFTDEVLGPIQPVASLTQGAILLAQRILPSMQRYLRVVYRIATAALTAGVFTAFLTLDQDIIDLSMREFNAIVVQAGQLSEAVSNGVLDS